MTGWALTRSAFGEADGRNRCTESLARVTRGRPIDELQESGAPFIN